MHIEARPHERIKERWEIFVNGEKWREVHRSVFGKKLQFPSIQDEEEWETFFYAFEYKRVKGYVSWRLSSQSYHSEQLMKLLRERLVPLSTIERVIQEFKEMGALDDELWIQNVIRSGQKRYGLKYIMNKLHAKGLSKESIEQISQIGENPENEVETIGHLLKTRYRSKDLSQFKEKQKVIASLLRKGFSYALIQEALMTKLVCVILLCLSFFGAVDAQGLKPQYHQGNKKFYDLKEDPIDVVIVSHPKDKDTIDLCINGIRENCKQVRRVIVVSIKPLTDNAEWFDEKQYPFTMDDVFLKIGRGSRERAQRYFRGCGRPVGWFFQQLLKLYAPVTIPGISPNVLVIDADTVFMNPVTFLNEVNGGLFCTSPQPAKQRYLDHAKRMLPGYVRVFPEVYSVCHHMLFQRPILEDLFALVKAHHKVDFWKAFCLCVDLNERKGASEYEIYYNFALRNTDQVQLRPLKWKNSRFLEQMDLFKEQGFHYVSFHTYLRNKKTGRQ